MTVDDILPDQCFECGTKYRDFRTGYTFTEVKSMLWVASQDSSEWRYKRRHTVLGYWRMLKQELWKEHLQYCSTEIPELDTPGEEVPY